MTKWTVMANKARITDGKGNSRDMGGHWREAFYLADEVEQSESVDRDMILELAGHSPTQWAYDMACKARTRWQTETERLRKVLQEIAKGEGKYDRDHLRHAENTIADMKALAAAALVPAPDPRSGPDGPVADHVDGYRILPGEEDWNQPEE